MLRANALLLLVLASLGAILVTGCQPRSTPQKIEDKVEDAAHETKQGMERAGEAVDDAVNK